MSIRWLIPAILALGLSMTAQAENVDQLVPVSRSNVLTLLPIGLQSPNLQVLDVAVAGDDVYFLLGDGSGRLSKVNAIFRLRGDGTQNVTSLPEGQVRDLSVDAALNVHALLLPQTRRSEPKMVRCDAALSACTTTAFADGGRQVWARRPIQGHVAELSIDGALYMDGARVLVAGSEPSRLLSTPDGTRLMRLDQASGTLTVIEPSQPSARLVTTINGAEFQAATAANRAARANLPPNPNSGGLTIYAAATANDGRLFLALSPFNRFAGATIIQTTPDGTTERTIHCSLPKDDAGTDVITPVHVGVSGSRLFLISPGGDLLTYNL